jgi:putative mRNA 3-end processing factor
MALRYGEGFCDTRQSASYGETLAFNGVEVTFHPAGHVLGSAQICVCDGKKRIVVSGDYKRARDPTCPPFEPIRCDVFISEATFGLPVFRHADATREVGKLMSSLAMFPERAHLVGAYSLGKAQRMMALVREAGWDRPIWIHGALEKITEYYQREGVDLADVRKVGANDRARLAGEIVLCPPSSIQDVWSRKFPDPVAAFASGWMRVRARARQRGVELPLIVSDHADWDDLCATIRETGCSELWVTHGEADALAHWASTIGLKARPLHMVGYGDEDEGAPVEDGA